MQATMAAARATADKQDKTKVYNQQLRQLAEVRRGFSEAALASGAWQGQTVKTISSSQMLTQQMMKQNVTVGQAVKQISSLRKGHGALNEAIKEQTALRNAMASQMTGNAFGRNNADLFIPRNLGPELDSARVKYGMINQLIGAAAARTINWGKNTQWAGRQIMVGLTVPLGIAAVGAAALALKVDQNLTRIAKVYDTVNQGAMGQERELKALREQSLAGATRLAQTYGQKMQDVLDITAQLAATGQTGAGLHQATAEVTRIATLGEMEYQKAIDMTVSLQTAYKLSTEELTEAFNMMNAVENATSLSIDDIAEATPRAASALSSLGGTVKEMTVMLVAMKESGVNPEEGANALKSATTRLINPTRAAVEYFKTTFDIDLPKIVTDANGNIYELMQSLAGLTKGFDNLAVQKGIGELFGTYQFNRITALWSNLGDAVNGVQNQTAKAMETVGMSAEDLAGIADREMERWQNSIQGKFKTAVEGLKAALVPLGETVLGFITPLIKGIGNLIEGFNNLSGPVKGSILAILGIMAVVGPLLMLVGIFANLFGNVVRLSTWLANLKLRFRAQTAEEAASTIAARNATSAFDAQAQSAGYLAGQIRALTQAMEANAVAQGMMMSRGGVMANQGALVGTTRTVVQRANGSYAYAAGSVHPAGTTNAKGQDISGRPAGGQNARPADVAAYQRMQQSSAVIATNSERAGRGMSIAGKAAGLLTIGALAVGTMASGASETRNTVINIVMLLGIAASMGLFNGAIAGAKALAGLMTGLLGRAIAMQVVMARAFAIGGVRGMIGMLGLMVGSFKAISASAWKIFGPIGILIGGAFVIKKLIDKTNELYDAQEKVGKSAESWAEVIGFTYAPGTFAGTEEPASNHASRVDEVDKLREANEELADALGEAGAKADDFGTAYDMAVREALKVVTSGGTVAQAKQAFEIALQTAGASDIVIDRLSVKFDQIDLDDPESIADEIQNQVQSAIDKIPDTLPEMKGSLMDQLLGSHKGIGDDAAAAAREAGQLFATEFNNAADPQAQGNMFGDIQKDLDDQFGGMFKQLYTNISPEAKAEFERLGIDSMSALNKVVHDKDMIDPGAGQQWLWDFDVDDDAVDAYTSTVRAFYQGLADQGVITEAELSEINSEISTGIRGVGQVADDMGIPSPRPIQTLAQATSQWTNYLQQAELHGRKLSDEEKLLHLNSLRAAQGLEAATHWTQGFGSAASSTVGAANSLANALGNVADVRIEDPSQALGQIRSTMEGTMGDIYAEADRRLQANQDAQIDAIQARGEASQNALEAQGKAMDRNFDARQKEMDSYWDQTEKNHEKAAKAQTQATEDMWDARIQRIEDERDAVDEAYEARIDSINATIEAEREAEEERQRIFEAEKTRISRLAEMFNSNIDFNAAINSGNLDEAAKLFNDASARQQTWSLEDAESAAGSAADKREKELNAQIDAIDKEREARKEAYDEQIDLANKAKDAALEALRIQQDAAKENLEIQKQIAQERLASERQAAQDALDARRDADQKATASAVTAAQASFEADRVGLANRLRELQAFVPRNEQEMREHIARIEEAYRIYGGGLQLQGTAWSTFIANALKTNVTAAANALATEINWQALGTAISQRIEAGVGVTAGDLEFFIANGRFPDQTMESYAAQWQKVWSMGGLGGGGGRFEHEGGVVRHSGGPGWTSKDRTGIPRTASMYPSEVPAILKRGEFVVNENASRQHRALLESINNGGPAVESGDGHMVDALFRHTGGVAETAKRMPGAYGAMYGSMIESGVAKAITENRIIGALMGKMLAQQAAGASGYSGPMTGTIQGALNFARSQQGKPYIWGGSGPAGQDCSGFMSIIANYILGKNPPYGRIFATGSMSGGPGNVGPFVRGGGPSNAFRIGVTPNSHTAGTLGGINVESGSGHGPMVGGRALGNASGFTYQYYLPQADRIPQLRDGGHIKYDNTLANLHRKETVLTEPLSQALVRGVEEFANGGSNSYDVRVNFYGPVTSDIDVERAVTKAINKKESKIGRKRTIT